MKPFRDDTELAAALREMRPTPQPEFAAELDARAAAGFPPRLAPGVGRRRAIRERLALHPAATPARARPAPSPSPPS